jgi:hypothetical protein
VPEHHLDVEERDSVASPTEDVLTPELQHIDEWNSSSVAQPVEVVVRRDEEWKSSEKERLSLRKKIFVGLSKADFQPGIDGRASGHARLCEACDVDMRELLGRGTWCG